MTPSSDEVWRARMIEAIQRTKEYVSRGKSEFFGDEDVQQLVIHNLEHVVESADHLSQRFKKAHQGIDWKRLSQIRTLVVHQYADADPVTIWEFVRDDLSRLEKSVVRARVEPPET